MLQIDLVHVLEDIPFVKVAVTEGYAKKSKTTNEIINTFFTIL